MINLIWAMDENRLIGSNNKLPWTFKDDIEHFKKITRNKEVIMGRKTYLSMLKYYPNGNLPFSKIYILSKTLKESNKFILVDDLDSFFKNNNKDIYVIGGSKLYKESMKYADVLYITHVLGRYDGDTYFSEYSLESFRLKKFWLKPKLIFCIYERTKI